MKQVDMIKAYNLMELECRFKNAKSIEFDDKQNCLWVEDTGFTSWPLMDPITDLALNCAARDKYEVNIDYSDGDVIIWHSAVTANMVQVMFDSTDEVCRAVIECILKSKGKWEEYV